ncbi:MAG: hypothetical protein ACI4MN_00015 [Candidatus Coproplasma sp.]
MAHNYKFAKLNENGALEYAPVPLVIDGVNVWTNEETKYNALGYYKIERTEMPEKEGYYYTDFWELSENKVVQRWEEHENPVPEPTEEEQYAEAAKILLGESE